MPNFLERLFKREAPPAAIDDLTRRATAKFLDREDGPQVGAFWDEGEKDQHEYEAFAERFEHLPGVNFLTFVRGENIPELERWLHPSNPSAEAKVFIRLIFEMMQRGENLWEQPGILLYSDDWARREKATPQEMRDVIDALATIAVIFQKPVKLYLEDATGKLKVWDFNP